MIDNSKLYRNISNLPICDEIKKIALELADQVDMPVVFLLDSPLDRNYFSRHNRWHNQFWCAIQPQNYQSELERLIITGLYRAIEERQRHPMAIPSCSYRNNLSISGDSSRIEAYRELIARINSTIRTWCTNQFIEQYGLYTHPEVRKAMFQDRLRRLQEYLQLQKTYPGFRWYKEVEIGNAVDYGYYLACDDSYTDQFERKIFQFEKSTDSLKFMQMVNKVKNIFNTTQKYCRGDIAQEEEILHAIIDQLYLADMLTIDYQYVYNQYYPDKKSADAYVYAFVPEGIQNEMMAIQAIRWCNEAILLVNEQNDTFLDSRYPDVHINFIQDGSVNAYADGGNEEYYISISDSLILEFSKFCYENSFDETTCRFMWYFIALHEFAHIVHGDCTMNACDIKAREEAADNQALQWIKSILPMQPKYHPVGASDNHIREMMRGLRKDICITEKIMGIIEKFRRMCE